MAYNYLSLTNDVCRRLNETELSPSTFDGAGGHYGIIKDSVNYSIRDINLDQYKWPFNLVVYDQPLTAGENRYSYPSNYKIENLNSFRIQESDVFNNRTTWLVPKDYNEYLKYRIDEEYDTNESNRRLPRYVFKGNGLDFVISPIPDQNYVLSYEYYQTPADLSLPTDVPLLPEQFRSTIVEGAMYYNYLFRRDNENTQISGMSFRELVGRMRSIYINKQEYVRSTMIDRPWMTETNGGYIY